MNEQLLPFSPQLKALLVEFESCELVPYLCPANRLTIGYGHVLRPVDCAFFANVRPKTLQQLVEDCQTRKRVTQEAKMLLKITPAIANKLIEQDSVQVSAFLRSVTHIELNQNQHDALVSFIFNVGQGNYAKSTLKTLLNDGEFTQAAKEFERWSYASVLGKKTQLAGLLRRRTAERDLFLRED